MEHSAFFQSISGYLTIGYALFLVIAIASARRSGLSSSIPNISISLGIMFTFVGIFIALLGFDPANIQGSIPELLNGMRLAFVTSIIGMGIAILYRVTPSWGVWTSSTARAEGKGATLDTLALHLGQIEKALVGDGEATLNTQLQKLRLAFVEKQEEMIRAFRDFAKEVAENNTQALILALEEVMRDFNAKINEQLGDNFKKFNEGLGRMLKWQEEYKEQMGTMIDQVKLSLQAIQACEQALGQIEGRSRSFADTAEKLRAVVDTYDERVRTMEAHLDAFAKTADRAEKAFPTIEKNMKDLTQGLKESIDEVTKTLQETAKEQHETIEQLTTKTAERINEQLSEIDKQLAEELKKSLTTLGSQLASLSSKFVDDYTPLTEQLRKLVKASESANGNSTNGTNTGTPHI